MEAKIVPMTLPSIRFAVETAELFPNYRSTIFVSTNEIADKVYNHVLNYIDVAKLKKINNFEVVLKNGSIIRVCMMQVGSKGYRSNLIVYDRRFKNRIVNTVIKPMLAHYFESGVNKCYEIL